jgi:hypothetical protein
MPKPEDIEKYRQTHHPFWIVGITNGITKDMPGSAENSPRYIQRILSLSLLLQHCDRSTDIGVRMAQYPHRRRARLGTWRIRRRCSCWQRNASTISTVQLPVDCPLFGRIWCQALGRCQSCHFAPFARESKSAIQGPSEDSWDRSRSTRITTYLFDTIEDIHLDTLLVWTQSTIAYAWYFWAIFRIHCP